ncbi:MAG TPA: DoxX family membrane protein [Rectinemataceae bacterium]|nr:DoxX family membrane protein [Rectinemataceae bacterium]
MGRLILRLMLGGLLLFHGVSKLVFGIAWIQEALAAARLPPIAAYGVYVGEVLAPLLLILGLWSRVASLIVAFDLLVAILLVRLPAMFSMDRTGGWAMEQDFFFLLSALAVFLLGPGRLALGSRGRGAA